MITPSAYGTTAVTDFTDPMANTAVPTYAGATTNCTAVGIVSSSSTTSGCLTATGSPATSATLASGVYGNVTLDLPTTVNPGEFESLTVGNTNETITFNAGTYIFDGSGIDVNATGTTLTGTGLTFYLSLIHI